MTNKNTEKLENIIHPTAIIHPSVKMGVGNYIGPYSIIDENVIIGDNNYIGPHCIIGDVGESINFFDKDKKGVIIGNNNRFTKKVSISGGTVNATEICNNTLWMNNAHACHDCKISDNVQLRANSLLAGHVTVLRGAQIYLGAIVHQRMTVPEECIIGMGAIVTKKVELVAKGIYAGNPARLIRMSDKEQIIL